jgi:predicted ATP-dependent endonuclease of OLD family
VNTELTLKDFKRIEEHIQLRNFNQVNYFVGKNASGKSSILNALSYLNDGSNSRHFFTRHSTVDFKLGSKNQFIVWEDEKINPNNVSHKGNLILKIFTPENGGIEKGANGVYKPKFIFDNIGKAQLDFINQVSEKLNLNSLKAERIINNNDPWSSEVGTRVFKDKDKTVNLLFLSQGLKTFMDLSYVITQAFGSLKEDEKHSVDAIFFIFEEPENNLHPELQKKVPDFFHEVISGLDQILKEKIYFFVSTHSPFVISAAAKYPNQKVYLIDNGSLLDIQRNTVNFSDGYSGAECAWVVGQMLGSDITDLGYPENYCILEEYSLQLLLEDSRNKNIIKNVQFVSASGVMRAISLNDTINELLNLNTIIK